MLLTFMNVFGGLSFVTTYVYALCASGAVNTHVFVWKFVCTTYTFSFIHLPMVGLIQQCWLTGRKTSSYYLCMKRHIYDVQHKIRVLQA